MDRCFGKIGVRKIAILEANINDFKLAEISIRKKAVIKFHLIKTWPFKKRIHEFRTRDSTHFENGVFFIKNV